MNCTAVRLSDISAAGRLDATFWVAWNLNPRAGVLLALGRDAVNRIAKTIPGDVLLDAIKHTTSNSWVRHADQSHDWLLKQSDHVAALAVAVSEHFVRDRVGQLERQARVAHETAQAMKALLNTFTSLAVTV